MAKSRSESLLREAKGKRTMPGPGRSQMRNPKNKFRTQKLESRISVRQRAA
jgi:hypothetical protein